MQSNQLESKPWVLLTGATGLLGSAVLNELLAQGCRVLCVVRALTPDDARKRLSSALALWGCAAEKFLENGQVAALRGDLCRPSLGFSMAAVQRLGKMVGSVVHAAGSTHFSTRADPNLVRINVDGTRIVFEFADSCGCKDWHLFSTAYVCGRCDRAEEMFRENAPEFRNEYEWTKWTAERESRSAAARCGASLTTYRPSVIVGHSETGAIARFSGIYRVFRAVSLLDRAVENRGDIDRHQIPLRLPADAFARPNLVFVDDVAREFTELFNQSASRNGTFHLTHPDPPSNGEIQKALERYYDIAGGRFVGAQSSIPKSQRTAYEEIFFDVVLDTEPYILESPIFDRTQTNQFVSRPPTPWNGKQLQRQIHFAENSNWRRSTEDGKNAEFLDVHYAAYFERFMPESHRHFRLSEFPTLNLDVRYRIGRSAKGDWFCRFRRGRLIDAAPTNGIAADFTYRIAPAAFWDIVGGKSSATETFLSGAVQIEGNIERALKFAAILQEFVREFPYTRPLD